MLRLARMLCPATAVMIVVAVLRGMPSFNPGPESPSVAGMILLTVLLAASQAPLALAPRLSAASRETRALLTLGMLPTAAALVFIAVDLAPRLLFPDYTSAGTVLVAGLSLFAYTVGFFVLWRRPHSPRRLLVIS